MARTRHRPKPQSLAEKRQEATALEVLAAFMLLDADDDDDEDLALSMAVLAHQARLNARGGKYGRRGSYNMYDKCKDFFEMILFRSSDRIFKGWLRYVWFFHDVYILIIQLSNSMERDTFWHIHDLICTDPIFQPKEHGRKQMPVCYQLAAFLIYAGDETAVHTASVLAIAEGSVFKYQERSQHALRRLKPSWIKFPEPGILVKIQRK
jgi:hypothetical protein